MWASMKFLPNLEFESSSLLHNGFVFGSAGFNSPYKLSVSDINRAQGPYWGISARGRSNMDRAERVLHKKD